MTGDRTPVPWWEAEPTRLAKDQREIGEAFPSLAFSAEGQAAWTGVLPRWPFPRPKPDGLEELVPAGAAVLLAYGAAYPSVSPYIFPFDPEPEPTELTQTRWHVLGNGALCLFQTQADWDPASSIVDLLRRAAGWRVEYALLKAGARTDMTMASIVNDDSLDALITETAAALAEQPPQTTPQNAEPPP